MDYSIKGFFVEITSYYCIQSIFLPSVSLLKDLKHSNIVTLHDIVHTPKSMMLVFEYLVRYFLNDFKSSHEHYTSSYSYLAYVIYYVNIQD